jgi:type I restriction enzyme, R subunit
VDMIATGTDIKPLEVLIFLRDVRSRVYFEQMKGRGTRVLTPTDLQSVSGEDARAKTHFVLVDSVGLCESDKTESRPLDRKPTRAFHGASSVARWATRISSSLKQSPRLIDKLNTVLAA